jgi:hypothetical protein
MRTQGRNLGPLLAALGLGFALLNLTDLVFLDGGWPEIVGLAFGFVLAGIGLARWRGGAGVGA